TISSFINGTASAVGDSTVLLFKVGHIFCRLAGKRTVVNINIVIGSIFNNTCGNGVSGCTCTTQIKGEVCTFSQVGHAFSTYMCIGDINSVNFSQAGEVSAASSAINSVLTGT